MEQLTAFLYGLAPSLIVAMVAFYWQRGQKRRDEKAAAAAAVHRKESRLIMDLQMATAKLAYANACAIKRGAPNGEIEEGIEAYMAARAAYLSFMNDQAFEHLHE